MNIQQEIDGQIRLTQFTDYPGFEKSRQYLKSCGAPYEWIDYVVDPTNPYAKFLKNGKPGYLSQCPDYQGYWLLGGRGSVQCAASAQLIPGLHWYITCSQNYENCPLRKGG